MEPERTAPELAADLQADETTGGSPESCKLHEYGMQGILSEIQSLVERSSITNRALHMDLNWYLKSSPGEPEIRLMRTVQNVLACRFQPARLDVAAMAEQLQEAENYRCCVQKQVATMKCMNATWTCHPDALKSLEGQWSAALLDASATVQVKEAQLDQVKQYHKQMRIIRTFLEVLVFEKEKTTLDILGSSALRADGLNALLTTMAQKKYMMEELLHLSSQLSVHLCEAESSGALLTQLGDVQEEWRLLEGSLKRALQLASNSTCQSSLLKQDAEQLKAKLEDLQKSKFHNLDTKSALELVCLKTDIKLYNQLYMQLQSWSDVLFHFSLGQKEKDEIKHIFQELKSLIDVSKSKIDTSTDRCGRRINKQLQDLIIWAKQAETHIPFGQKIALFPEEAHIQIAEMKRFQMDFWTRRSKMQVEVEQIKDLTSDMEVEDSDQVLKTIEDLYKAIADSLDHRLGTMMKNLQNREKLFCQIASMDAWLAETHANRDPCIHVENVSKAELRKLESELKSHKLAIVEIKGQLKLVEATTESCREIAKGLSPGESRYLVNRLSGLWTELDGLLAHEKATSWELQDLIHERIISNEELSTIQASLQQISTGLAQQTFPCTNETISTIQHFKHRLLEYQCEVQELQHCQEAELSSLLCTIGEMQDQCKALTVSAFEQDKYLHLTRQIEESKDLAKEQIQRANDKTVSVSERFRLCQTLLIGLPFVKTQCQEAADQLEAIAQELNPPELDSERQMIHHTVETLVSWENSVRDDIKNLEAKLLSGLHFSSELPALMELFRRAKAELDGAEPLNPDEKTVDIALQRHWVIWRNVESGMRVLEGLGHKENINLKNYKELYSLQDATKQECHLQMESLSQARESLKDYQWAAQGAISFLHNAEATFLSAPGGFLDCTEEQRQTQQALEALEDGFKAHISHLTERLPQQPCLSRSKTEELHITILCQLLVGRAVLEAQAQLRLESLQRCKIRQQSHRKCHEDIRQQLSELEAKISECAAEHVTSYEKCVAQRQRAELLMERLRSLSGKIEELRAGCPMQGCGVGKDGELGTLWRCWVSLRRGVGLLMAHIEQRAEEWKDITTSMEQCCGFLASLQSHIPDSSTASFTVEEPQGLLAQAEICQTQLEQGQLALASLEHRLEHALSLSSSQDPIGSGPVGETLAKIQENVRRLKERNLLVVAAAQAEEKERQQVQEELREDLSSQKVKLRRIEDSVQCCNADIPADISRSLQDVQLVEKRNPVRKLDSQVVELESCLDKVRALLEQRSLTVSEAQRQLKQMWDELDMWHSRLTLLENEVQDLADDQPDQAHLLMDQLTQLLQLYHNAAQMAEQRTTFLSKIPACLQEFEGIVHSAACWLDEAQSWLGAPCSLTTAKSLQIHGSSLQLVLDDSGRIRHALHDFKPCLDEVSAVCDVSTQEERLDQIDQQVHKMQCKILEPLEQLLQAVGEVEAIEAELKTIEKNVQKIRAILSSLDDSGIPLTEHLHNQQLKAILANVRSMQRTLEEVERRKGGLHLPRGSEESLLIFSRARSLLQPLEELEQLAQRHAALLENEIGEEDPRSAALSEAPEGIRQLDGSPQRHLHQGGTMTVEMSNPEEEGDLEDESCHSSSSDTPTGSIPEAPESRNAPSEMDTSSNVAGTESDNPGTSETGFATVDSEDDGGKVFSPESEAADEGRFCDATLVQSGPPTHETRVTDAHAESIEPAGAAQETLLRLTPAGPDAAFTDTVASHEFTQEGGKDVSLATAPGQDLEQKEVNSSESLRAQEPSEVLTSLTGSEEDEEVQQRWSRLRAQISQRLTSLEKAKEEHQTVMMVLIPQREEISSGSASAVLQQTRESVTMLRQIVSSADRSTPGVNEELYNAARSVLLCLDSVAALLSSPSDTGGDESQLRLLQHECVSTGLVTLAEMLSEVESETSSRFSTEEPEALHCLSSLQDCLHAVQLVFTSSRRRLSEHLGIALQHQELSSNQLCILDEFELGRSEMFPGITDVPSLKQCVLGRHLRESPVGGAQLQQVYRSLLRGIIGLLELGEECITDGQISQVHSCSQLHAVLCRRKNLLQVLRSQLAFVQSLSQRQPEALKCQEDERLQLEARAKALLQRALEQEVASQRKAREWTQWEEDCGRLGRRLDDLEASISCGESEGDDDDELAQHRLEVCQRTLVQLEESRAALGLLLDQGKGLQAESECAATVSHAGGALELRWQSVYRCTELEIQRRRDIQDRRVREQQQPSSAPLDDRSVRFFLILPRFLTDTASVSDWMLGAGQHLTAWSKLVNTSDLNQEAIHDHLIKLLDFSMETEAMSVKKASASREAAQLLQLREADCPRLRADLAQMEIRWSELTSDLREIQNQLQQQLLPAWPPLKLLSDLEDWQRKLETCLSREREALHQAKDGARIAQILQHYHEFKEGIANGQLLLDFLCQNEPRVIRVVVQALSYERTVFAEKLGALRLQWLHLQTELESQIREAERMHHTCADRERKLQRLRGWIERQRRKLDRGKQPSSQTLACRTLQELEAVEGRASEVAASLRGLEATRVRVEKGQDHPCDVSFSDQAKGVRRACGNLSQQIAALRPALQQAVEELKCFERVLREVSLHTSRMHCSLNQRSLLSLRQAEECMDLLQLLREQVGKGEELWASVDKCYQKLVKIIHGGTAQALEEQMEGERKRWKDVARELRDVHLKTGETLDLWQRYSHLSDRCSLRLKALWRQWEELSRSSPPQDAETAIHSVARVQEAVEDLQSTVDDAHAASKGLIGRLEPRAADLIQSENESLSCDILLLRQATSGKMRSLQEDLEQRKLFDSRMEAQNIQSKLKDSSRDTDSVEVLLELRDLFASLLDVKDTSGHVTLNHEMERVNMFRRQWVESMTHMSDMNRELRAERQHHRRFQEKCESLSSIRRKLEQESSSGRPQSYSVLQEMRAVHRQVEAEIITGHQLLQDILCDAVESIEKETGEKRSELLAQVTSVRESWFNSVSHVRQYWCTIKDQLNQWRVYHHGMKLLQKLLRNVVPFLHTAEPSRRTLHQLWCCMHDYQDVEDALGRHGAVYTQTLEAGRRLCEAMMESEGKTHLQSELQAIQEAWEGTASMLERRRDTVDTTIQKWSQCQERVTITTSELEELETKLKRTAPGRPQSEEFIQETELHLQRLASGLREVATMKTDLSQCVAAGDSSLLEQQLEQLHAQWEELCTKVSVRRQEIADRLNAWTIFNDKNKEFCDWLTRMENKVCRGSDLSIEEMVEKLKKDCMEEINLFSENKSHLKRLGEQLLLASDEAKQTQVHGSLLEVNQRWHNLFHHIEARVKKLKDTLVTVQQLDKNMSNLRSWLSRIEAELSRPITYSVCHQQEIQRRLVEQQELQRDIEQHTEGVVSVLSLCDVLLRDEDAAVGTEVESDSLQETSRSLDQCWRTICAMALDRRLRIEETWRLWCKFLDDYSRFEDWLTVAEHTAANPNSADILYTVAKEELKKFEGFQRQVHERLTQLELVNNQYRRLARENRTDRASQLKAMVHEGNRRWDTLHRRAAAILRRLKYFTSQREEFEGTRESMLVWLTELDLQLTNVEHFSECDVHHKIEQLNSFQKEITLNTERIDGLIVFGEGLIQKSSPQDAALIEDELEELHSYCQEVFSRLVRFHQRLSQPPMVKEEPELCGTSFSLESSLELISRLRLMGRGQGSLPATPTHLLASPLLRSGRETPVSVDSLPLEWDHTVDVGGSSSHEEEEEEEEGGESTYFSALSVSSRSAAALEPPRWRSQEDAETQTLQQHSDDHREAPPTLTSTPLKRGYLQDVKRVPLILGDGDSDGHQETPGPTGLTASDKQSGVIERWDRLLQAQSRGELSSGPRGPQSVTSDLHDVTLWLENTIPALEGLGQSGPAGGIDDVAARAKELREMQEAFARHRSAMLSVNLRAHEAPGLRERLAAMNRGWRRACAGLQRGDASLSKMLMGCQEFHEALHSLLLWLAHAESRRHAVDVSRPETPVGALQQHLQTLTNLQMELRDRQTRQASLQALWSQLQPPEEGAEEREEAREKLHVTGSKLRLLVRQVDQDIGALKQRLDCESAPEVRHQRGPADAYQEAPDTKRGSQGERRDSSPPRSLFYRVLRAALPLQFLLLLLLLLPCLIPVSESNPSCTDANNFARSFYPMLHYTNGPPPT